MRVALPFILSLASCSPLLGGLDEGTAPPIAIDGGGASCATWLTGFRYRVPVDAHSDEPEALAGYSLAMSFPTRELVAQAKLRPDGADIRVTRADGVTVLPHWIESGVGREATRIWTKADLSPGDNRVFVYYGNAAAEERGSKRDVFVDGVIANGDFSQGTEGWILERPGSADASANATVTGVPSIQVELARYAPAATSLATGVCQPIVVPSDKRYRIVLDLQVTHFDHGNVNLWTGGIGGAPILGVADVGWRRNVDTSPLPPGPTTLCLGVALVPANEPNEVVAQFGNLRLRVAASIPPMAASPGPEEQACAP